MCLGVAERAGLCALRARARRAPGGDARRRASRPARWRRSARSRATAAGAPTARSRRSPPPSGTCRRRALLDHFGDSRPGAPEGRCCDVCDPGTIGLPDPASLTPGEAARRRSSRYDGPVDDSLLGDAEGVAPARQRRQARLHGRPQQHARGDRGAEALDARRAGRDQGRGADVRRAARRAGAGAGRRRRRDVMAVRARGVPGRRGRYRESTMSRGEVRTRLFIAACMAAFCLASATASAVGVVPTDKGPVRGNETAAMKQYLGIPYAAPPVGDLRWRPPQAARALARSPRDATQFGNHCPQPASPFGLRVQHRGLPLPERLHAQPGPGQRPRQEPAGDGLDPRRRAGRRRERRLRPDAARAAGRDRRHAQLPARPARIPRAPRAERRVRRTMRPATTG